MKGYPVKWMKVIQKETPKVGLNSIETLIDSTGMHAQGKPAGYFYSGIDFGICMQLIR